jgi:hypothetical protein
MHKKRKEERFSLSGLITHSLFFAGNYDFAYQKSSTVFAKHPCGASKGIEIVEK